ncbi:hypothetical protein B0H21DRAFT_216896 [Amylocystis lapponica]|nr:hypothetical protein B0H21DRAFT_216896 [Amylocystis lapponica]
MRSIPAPILRNSKRVPQTLYYPDGVPNAPRSVQDRFLRRLSKCTPPRSTRGFVLSADSTLALAQAQSSTTLPGWISFDFRGNPPGTGMGVRRLLVLEPAVVVANLAFGNGMVLRGLTSIRLVLRWPGFAQHEFEKIIRVVGINGLSRRQLLEEDVCFIGTDMGVRGNMLQNHEVMT